MRIRPIRPTLAILPLTLLAACTDPATEPEPDPRPTLFGFTNHVPGDFIWDNTSDIVLQQDTTSFIKIWQTPFDVSCADGYHADTLVPAPYGPIDYGWRVRATGDLSGDGRPDLVFQNASSRRIVAWHMFDLVRTVGGFTNPAGPEPAPLDLRCTSDFNGDGQDDLGFQDANTGAVRVWRMDPSNPMQRLTAHAISSAVPGFDPAGYTLAGCGDFTGDGLADLVLLPDNDDVIIAEVHGYTVTATHDPGGPGRAIWNLGGIGDLDLDGHFELIWQRKDMTKVQAWRMENTDYLCTIEVQDGLSTWRVVGPK